MKQVSLVVNALLVIAVSYLLYKQFTTSSALPITASATLAQKNSTVSKKMLFAYINMDSIQNKYELAKQVTTEVERKRDAMTSEIKKMENAYKAKLEGYQKKAATMTEEQAVAAREDMAVTERNLLEKRQALDEEFSQWVSSKNLSVMKDIQDYLKKFNADGTYSFIFSYEPGLFYYKDTAYDITAQVLQGLNQEFKSKKKQF